MSKIKWRPAPGKIAVKIIGESEFLDKGQLILAAPTRANPRTTGEVVATYEPFLVDGVETEAFFKVGNKVIFGAHSGIEVGYGRNEKVVILREHEILTIVEVEEEDDIREVGVATPGTFDDLE